MVGLEILELGLGIQKLLLKLGNGLVGLLSNLTERFCRLLLETVHLLVVLAGLLLKELSVLLHLVSEIANLGLLGLEADLGLFLLGENASQCTFQFGNYTLVVLI